MKVWIQKAVIGVLLAAMLICPAAAEEHTAPCITILTATSGSQMVTITYRVSGRQSQQEVTCLVYGLEPDSTYTLLQVGQWAVSQNGIYVKTFAVPAAVGYKVMLGGTGIANPRIVVFESKKGYKAAATDFAPGETAEMFLTCLTGLEKPLIKRGEQGLTGQTLIQSGDYLTGVLATGEELSIWLVIYGDVNADGMVNAFDALQVLRHAVNKIQLTDAALAAADWEQTGRINASNALAILKFAVGKIESL